MKKLTLFLSLLSGATGLYAIGERQQQVYNVKAQENVDILKHSNKQLEDIKTSLSAAAPDTWTSRLATIVTSATNAQATFTDANNRIGTEQGKIIAMDGRILGTTTALGALEGAINTDKKTIDGATGDISGAGTTSLATKVQHINEILIKTVVLSETQKKAFAELTASIGRVLGGRQALQLMITLSHQFSTKQVFDTVGLAIQTPYLPALQKVTKNVNGVDHKNGAQQRLEAKDATVASAIQGLEDLMNALYDGVNFNIGKPYPSTMATDIGALRTGCMADATTAKGCGVNDWRQLLAILEDAYGRFENQLKALAPFGTAVDAKDTAVVAAIDNAMNPVHELLQDEELTVQNFDFSQHVYYPSSGYMDSFAGTSSPTYKDYLMAREAVLRGYQLAVEEAYERYMEALIEEIDPNKCTGVDATLGFVPSYDRLYHLLAVIYDSALNLVVAEMVALDVLASDYAHRDYTDRGNTYDTYNEAITGNITSAFFTAFKDDTEKGNNNWSMFGLNPFDNKKVHEYSRNGNSKFKATLDKLKAKTKLADTYVYP